MHWALSARAVVALGRLPHQPMGAGESRGRRARHRSGARRHGHRASRRAARARDVGRRARARAGRPRARAGARASCLPTSRPPASIQRTSWRCSSTSRAGVSGSHGRGGAARPVARRALLSQDRADAGRPHCCRRRARGGAEDRAPCRRLRHQGALCRASTACRSCWRPTCCHDASGDHRHGRAGCGSVGQSIHLISSGENSVSTWRWKAAARTAPSPGACSTACSRRRRSRSAGSAPPAPVPSTPWHWRRAWPKAAARARGRSSGPCGRPWPRPASRTCCATIPGSPASPSRMRWPRWRSLFSPYDFNPLGFDPFRKLLEAHVDFALLRASRGPGAAGRRHRCRRPAARASSGAAR